MNLRLPYADKELREFILRYIGWLVLIPISMLIIMIFLDLTTLSSVVLFWLLYSYLYINPRVRKKRKSELLLGMVEPSLYNAIFLSICALTVLFLGINIDRILTGGKIRLVPTYLVLMVLEYSIMDNYGFYVHYFYQFAKEIKEAKAEE